MKVMTTRPPRPVCFGAGLNADTGQYTTLDDCRVCDHVSPCTSLRQVRLFEDVVRRLRAAHQQQLQLPLYVRKELGLDW